MTLEERAQLSNLEHTTLHTHVLLPPEPLTVPKKVATTRLTHTQESAQPNTKDASTLNVNRRQPLNSAAFPAKTNSNLKT